MMWRVWISLLVCGYIALFIDWAGAGQREVELLLLGANLTILLDEICIVYRKHRYPKE
jgi:hypothetical protein